MRTFRARIVLFFSIIVFLFILFFARCYYLFVEQKSFLQNQGDLRALRVESIPNIRGSILDRNGKFIAVSTIVYDVWMNPNKLLKEKIELHKLKESLVELNIIDSNEFDDIFLEKADKQYVYLKRNISPNQAERLKALKLPFVFLDSKTKRYYPSSEVIAPLIGKTDIDDNGIEGIELFFNDTLKGKAGKQTVLKDRLGRTIKTIDLIQEPQIGSDLQLTIDLRLQFLAYKELSDAIEHHNAESGTAVILDVTNGDILAMANFPSFNPNGASNIDFNAIRNRAITDVFEPGSVFKPFSMAMAMEHKNIDKDDFIDTSPGFFNVKNKTVKDIRNYGKLKVKDILVKSSNVGISKIISEIKSDKFINFLYNLGFTYKVQHDLHGETSGWINQFLESDMFSYYTLAFGYGVAVNALQLVRAYAAIGNQGYLPSVNILKKDLSKDIEYKNKIMSKSTANQILDILHEATGIKGTAKRAAVSFSEVAGKTGTTRRIVSGVGYDATSHNAMFVGLAPYPNPKLAMVVFIADPKDNGYYGGLVAAPVFSKVMGSAVRILGLEQEIEGNANAS